MHKLVLIIIHCAFLISAQEFTAGQETTLPWPKTVNKHVKVYLPENYTKDKKWPVIFYYHGMNGKPDTKLFQKYTSKKDFIIVSMDYFVKGTQRFATELETRAYYQKEFNNLLKVKTTIQSKISIDPKKLYLAGVSKGGWISSVIAETHLTTFSGVIIFLAGKMGGPKRPMVKANRAGIPIYVGVGEQDGNFIAGVATKSHFKPFRAALTLEVFDELGHNMPEEIPPLFAAWLDLHRPNNKIDINSWLNEKMDSLNSNEPKDLIKAYRDLKEHPYVFKLSIKQKNAYVAKLNEKLKAIPKFAEEYKAYIAYFKALESETKAGKPQDWEKVVSQLKAIQKKYPGTVFGAKTEYQVKRASETLEKARAYFKQFEK